MPDGPDANRIVACRVRSLRLARSWSQEELADRCGLHRTYVGAIERGERNVTVNTLFRLALALRCSACDLLSTKGTDGVLGKADRGKRSPGPRPGKERR
ncbi:MAG: helix-turn-helix transcriptional regulator [Thermoguttaceae bacterium]|nr:helix-turn-helix transcriptional regulator [Thermoguttaceae bacterium]